MHMHGAGRQRKATENTHTLATHWNATPHRPPGTHTQHVTEMSCVRQGGRKAPAGGGLGNRNNAVPVVLLHGFCRVYHLVVVRVHPRAAFLLPKQAAPHTKEQALPRDRRDTRRTGMHHCACSIARALPCRSSALATSATCLASTPSSQRNPQPAHAYAQRQQA